MTRRDEGDLGELHVLCERYADHLSDILDLDLEPGPAHALFSSLDASVAFIEPDYFDVDFRSEFTATQETTFAAYSPDAERVHFFAGPPPARSVRIYDYLRMVAANQRSPRGSSEKDRPDTRRYLGYAVLRSSSPTIGRSLLSPEALGPRVTAGQPYDYIRTMVTEQVTVLGVQLQAIGVPFMQQDGTLLRCASVTAWMAHYTSVLRGYVPRRPSAAFSAVHGAQQLAYGRPYPDNFVTAMTQTQILQARDLPPEVLHPEKLTTGRELRWTDRLDLEAHLQAVSKTKKKRERDSGVELAWFVENLTASVCRYLNSGFPCIINIDDHSYLACGYVRSQYLDGRPEPTSQARDGWDPRSVAAFVVQDDQAGPYQVLGVSDLMGNFTSGKAFSVVVPLPRGLWLDGNSAETAGLRAIEELLAERVAEVATPSPGFKDLRQAMHHAAAKQTPSGRFGVRSFVSVSSDFKRDFGRRCDDAVAARLAGYTLMPKFVWAVEIYDRDLQSTQSPATIATIALDGSSVSMDGVIRPPAPVFVHLPGEVGIVRVGANGLEDWAWEPVSVQSYVSGRWSVRNSVFANASDLAARLKTSMASSSI